MGVQGSEAKGYPAWVAEQSICVCLGWEEGAPAPVIGTRPWTRMLSGWWSSWDTSSPWARL